MLLCAGNGEINGRPESLEEFGKPLVMIMSNKPRFGAQLLAFSGMASLLASNSNKHRQYSLFLRSMTRNQPLRNESSHSRKIKKKSGVKKIFFISDS